VICCVQVVIDIAFAFLLGIWGWCRATATVVVGIGCVDLGWDGVVVVSCMFVGPR